MSSGCKSVGPGPVPFSFAIFLFYFLFTFSSPQLPTLLSMTVSPPTALGGSAFSLLLVFLDSPLSRRMTEEGPHHHRYIFATVAYASGSECSVLIPWQMLLLVLLSVANLLLNEKTGAERKCRKSTERIYPRSIQSPGLGTKALTPVCVLTAFAHA